MAEICVDCWNKRYGVKNAERQFVISKTLDLCEVCGEYKHTIVCFRKRYLFLEWVRDWIAYFQYRRKKAKEEHP